MNTDSEPIEHVGCIDGSVLRVAHQGAEVHLHFGSSVAPLSRNAAQRLAALLNPSSAPPISTRPPMPQLGASRRLGAANNPRVADLLAAGLIDDGTILTLRYRGVEHTATVSPNGEVEYDGRPHASLSSAARTACAGASVNGWTAWRLFDGPPIDDLRWLLRADGFPGEGHSYSPSSAGEMRQIARWWVQHALAAGLDPSNPDDDEIDALLSGHRYAESTLGSYRRHLRNWRILYSRDARTGEIAMADGDDGELGSAS